MDYREFRDRHIASASIHTRDEFRSTQTPITFFAFDGAIRYAIGMGWGQDQYYDVADLPSGSTLSCWEDTSDEARAQIIAAGYALPYATRAEQKAAADAMWARIATDRRAEQDARDARMAADDNLPQDIVIEPTADQMRIYSDDGESRIVHVLTDGLSVLTDEGPKYVLAQAEAEILHEAPAIRSRDAAYVGTITGELEEIRYKLPDGQTRYIYTLYTSAIDTYCSEMWSSGVRLSADAAANVILRCRDRRTED